MNHLDGTTQEALQALSHCALTCHSMALVHCLEMGGAHTHPPHLRLMLDCASVCTTTAELAGHKSQFHTQMAALCAVICETCAEACAALGDMEDCVAACQRCAAHCRTLARAAHAEALDKGASHAPS